MDQVGCCLKEDIPAVAELHLKVYGNPNNKPLTDLESYYRKVLFENPWYDEKIPSLVFRSERGVVEGLLGVLVRPMIYKGNPIRMAVPHNLMVAPDCRTSMAAIQIARKFIDGPQDLVFGDGANDQSSKLMEAMGATVSYHSMHWLCVLRPGSYAGHVLERKQGSTFLGVALRPACLFADSLGSGFMRRSIRSKQVENCSVREVNNRSLLLSIKDLSSRSPLHPEYCEADLQWTEGFLQGNAEREQAQSIEVRNEKDQRVGVCLYRLGAKKDMEVLFLWAREDAADLVFSHVLGYALNRGAISVEGRMDPCFLQGISDHNCLLRRRSWVVVHARDPGVLNVIYRGDAMLSVLDGEFVVTK